MEPVTTLHFGPFLLDGTDNGLWYGPKRCKLTPKAEAILRCLVARPGRLVRRAELLAAVWPELHTSDWVLTTCIRELRHVLGDVAKAPHYIATEHRQGYRFIAPVTVVTTPPAFEAPPAEPKAVAMAEEHKLVTILCGSLVEAPALALQLGPERWYRLLQMVVALIQEVLHDYGGTLTLATGDSFTAVFGIPMAQEDHAHRAVVAAVELRLRLRVDPALHTQLAGDTLTLAIGLHSGRVVVGSLGQDPQRLAAAVGAPLHIATRLQQQAAPGMIVLSAATYQLVQAEVQAIPCGETLATDGQSTPGSAYTVQALRQWHAGVVGRGRRVLSPFVGRERELALLQDRLAEAMAGRGQVVGVVGAPGMGKTRLLREFCRRVSGKQVAVYEGQCLPYGKVTPYLPVRDIVRQLCGLAEGSAIGGQRATVQQWLHACGITAQDDVALLMQLLDLPVSAEALMRLSPEARQVRTFALLRHLILEAAKRRPLVLVVENLHWIDPTSAAWLGSLIEPLSGAAVLLLGTYRPEYQPAWSGHAVVTQVAVSPLSASESWTVVQSVSDATALPESQQRALVARAGGNPFFLEELAWHAVEQGRGDAPEVVPETVYAVLAARMDRLPAEAKHLLQTAAVIGHEVPVSLLQTLAQCSEATLHGGLAHLQMAEFLYETRLFPEQVYTFKHALTHEVAYSSLLQERRRMLHAQIVEILENLAADRMAEQVNRLAHHALRGEVWDKALTYSRQAGHQAAARSAYREAALYMEQALVILPHLPESRIRCEQAIDLRLDLREALWRLGEWGQVLTYLHEAEGLAESLGDPYRLAQISYNIADGYRIRGGYERARLSAGRALDLAGALGDRPLQIEARAVMGQIHYHLGNYGQAIELLQQSLTDLACGTPSGRDADALDAFPIWQQSWLLLCLSQVGAFQTGETICIDIQRMAETSAYPFKIIVAAYGVGMLFLRQGKLLQAISVLERGLALCHTSEIKDWLPTLAAGLGYAYALVNRPLEALPLLEQAVEQYAAMRGVPLYPAVMVMQSETMLIAGRLEDAMAIGRRALNLARHHQERGSEALALGLLGDIAARVKPLEADQAEAYYSQSFTLANELGMRPLQAHCHRGLGILYCQTGRLEQARNELSKAIDMYREMEMTFWLPQSEVALEQLKSS